MRRAINLPPHYRRAAMCEDARPALWGLAPGIHRERAAQARALRILRVRERALREQVPRSRALLPRLPALRSIPCPRWRGLALPAPATLASTSRSSRAATLSPGRGRT